MMPSKILQNLYLGTELQAMNKNILDSLNIKAVVNVTVDVPNFFQSQDIYYHRVAVEDNLYTEISDFFDEVAEFIDSHTKNGRSVLVHCKMGISRSPAFVIAYIMKNQRKTFEEAEIFVRERHQKTDPNLNFCGQLVNYKF